MGFIGGQISADNNAKAVGATLEQQTRNVLGFVRRTLNEGGMDESHVAKLYIYYSRTARLSQLTSALIREASTCTISPFTIFAAMHACTVRSKMRRKRH